MARKPTSYWEKRQTQLMKSLEKNTEPTINELISVYRQATDNINREIVRIYNNYGKESGLTKQALDHLLNTRETQTHYDNLLKVIQNNITDEDLKKKLLAKYTAPAYNYRISRYQALQEDIDMELKKAADKEIEITRMRYVDTIKTGYYRNIFDVQKGLNLAFHFNEVDNKTINLLLKEKWTNNANFSTRIWKNSEKLGEYLKTQLSAASLSGKSIQKISSDLAHYMNAGIVQATTLVRTEVNHFANEAEMLAYKELDIEEYRFIATLDKVTCVHCAKLDKRKFKVKEKKIGVNYPPIHPNDRCTTIAVFDDQDIDELKRRARNPETNQNYVLDQTLSYNDWYNKYVEKSGNMEYNTIDYIRKNQYSKYKNLDTQIKKALKMLPDNIVELISDTEIKVTKNNSYYDRKQDKIYLLKDADRYEVLHEIGHAIETKLDLLHNQEYLRIQRSGININNIQIGNIDGYDEKYEFWLGGNKFISDYQRRVYDTDIDGNERLDYSNFSFNTGALGEYFSEGFKYYFKSNTLLKRKDIELYNYIKGILK